MRAPRRRRSARASSGSKNAPMPASSRIDAPPARGRAGSGTRAECDSARPAAIHFSHIAFGALPNIAPPSSRCEFPSTDVSVRTGVVYHAYGRLMGVSAPCRVRRLWLLGVGHARDAAGRRLSRRHHRAADRARRRPARGAARDRVVVRVRAGPASAVGRARCWYGHHVAVDARRGRQRRERRPRGFPARACACARPHEPGACPRVYHGSGVDARYLAWSRGGFRSRRARAPRPRSQPWKPAATFGALASWQRGRWAVTTDPYFQLGLANTDLGNGNELVVPVYVAVQPACGWALALETGYSATPRCGQDGYHIPLALELTARATRTSTSARRPA